MPELRRSHQPSSSCWRRAPCQRRPGRARPAVQHHDAGRVRRAGHARTPSIARPAVDRAKSASRTVPVHDGTVRPVRSRRQGCPSCRPRRLHSPLAAAGCRVGDRVVGRVVGVGEGEGHGGGLRAPFRRLHRVVGRAKRTCLGGLVDRLVDGPGLRRERVEGTTVSARREPLPTDRPVDPDPIVPLSATRSAATGEVETREPAQLLRTRALDRIPALVSGA